jgi:diguanylate cyclase (GGDEF)-like protein
MEKISTWKWIVLLLALRGLLQLTPLPDAHDLFGLLVTTALFVFIWFKLNYQETLLRPFLIGIFIYWLGYIADYIDGLTRGVGRIGYMADMADDILFAIGFFLIGITFLRVTNERTDLVKQLQSENQRSLQLQQSLYQQAYTDELTGLGNRRALFECLENKLRNQESGTLLYIDVNNFKPVNDHFGHDVGDSVLQRCAKYLNYQGAQAFRLGGDEFVALLDTQDPPTWILDLSKHAKTLAQEYGVSFSVGTAHFSANDKLTPDELLALADQAMYNEKVTRKNRSR